MRLSTMGARNVALIPTNLCDASTAFHSGSASLWTGSSCFGFLPVPVFVSSQPTSRAATGRLFPTTRVTVAGVTPAKSGRIAGSASSRHLPLNGVGASKESFAATLQGRDGADLECE
jgi:hypothetical protein